MSKLVKTEMKDVKFGDVFYRKSFGGYFRGPYLSLGFKHNQRTRKLPYSALINTTDYYKESCAIVAIDFTNKRREVLWTSEIYVDPTASVLIQGLQPDFNEA